MMQIKKNQFVLLLIGVFIGGAVLMGAVCAFIMNTSGYAMSKDDKLSEIQKYIDSYYLNDYDKDKLIEGAYKGYVEGLDDPYSAYLDSEEFSSWMVSATGDYDGVGITFSEDDNGNFVIVSVNPDSPALKAGIEPGDYILKVDGKTYDDSDIMASDIRGDAGTSVIISIYHDGETQEIEMTRDKIKVQSVTYEIKDNNIGYIKIDSFIENTGEDFENALSELEKQGAESIILDLRDNGGGLVEQAIIVADAFLDKGVVCYTEDKNNNSDSYEARDGKTSMKTVVLINGNSASASEIVAGALKDNSFDIVGEKSFGKGVIQSTIDFEDGSGLKLTVMQYLSPDKHVIHKKGIKPTVVVKDNKKTEADEQLDKAEELLR